MTTRCCEKAHGGCGRPLIDEELFKGILVRERRRSDRSNQPFVLLLLGVNGGLGADSHEILDKAIGALAVATRGTDIAGWMEGRALIGVVLPEISPSDLPSACDGIETRFRRALATRVPSEAFDALSIRFLVYPEPRRAGAEGRWPVDPILYPDLTLRQARRTKYDFMKRGLDIIASLTLLIILSPLLLTIAALVKLGSPGPVVFKQMRIGRMTKPFTMFKFRTMYSNADDKVHRDYVSSLIKAAGQAHDPGQNGFFKLTNDPRVTRLGRLLRKTSLDELPQLWNVLRGDMSLVGPRPPLPYELAQYEPWHRWRLLEVMPGITGLWQVTGRSRTSFDEMVRLDVRYARKRSLWTDVKILLATPAAVVSGKGAC
jgi:lipopolysaccharide/colanic/teichoic acid biosynthesis glycosyltransferase